MDLNQQYQAPSFIHRLMCCSLHRLGTAALLPLLLSIQSVYASPFSTCPSKAFLFQGNPVSTYGVNLVTGSFALIEDDSGVDANINGLGFDEQDRYLYGFNTSDLTVVRLDGDYQATALNVTGLPASTSFFVGDIANHYYYLYRKNVGLYRIDLTPLDNDINASLTAQLITANASVNLTDIAFHPNDMMLYGVDNGSGDLYQINPETGAFSLLGDSGEKGTFGAMYFDVNGYFYLSRNQDGKIYRIDLSMLNSETEHSQISELDVTAIHFADGPSSSQNDGARCASAPLIDEDTPSTIDFGDAPASYATLLADNGPRHLLDNQTYLGLSAPDGDYDGYTGADSDDSSIVNVLSLDDEDGVNFVTALEVGLDSVITVYASREGILSAWFDWNGDGDFADSNEHTLIDMALQEGVNIISLRVPDDAVAGNTWSRFRFSEQAGLNYFGGSNSGEVEDHPVTISESGISYRYYPSANSWVTLAYEDQWPASDDYDMNDVVMHYRTVEVIRDGQIVRIDIIGELQALGGDYHNGFAVQLPDVASDNINQQSLRLLHNNVQQQYSGTNGATTYPILESGNRNAVLMISQDLWKQVDTVCQYHRTEQGCKQAQQFDFELSIPLINAIDLDILNAPYDPFIFATEGLYHGDIFTSHPGRGLEIHLVDRAPTDKFNTDFYGLADDSSDPLIGRYFRNRNNLPWALEITEPWQWPMERTPLLLAYPAFQFFVESNGVQNSTWFKSTLANASHLF
ncbi:LruC domain-containing protein [Psychromonas sp. psych-6C06]|uniref:LruC domain-containing protein n=1 Tax=Psychromonas sp. psych-6C06 TaxID=2058089 RepID=UPI000C32FF7D|nr:LruC domain-containing protein [Psychromonas sp. psych-6C06]PKF62467.1 LruC domain-containing protein [Psychromonas sp. psych-6C06]